jgi:shikimate 5-dehydrogenase
VVVGAGGAGRSAAFALARAGAEVRLSNRGVETGRHVAADLGVEFVPLHELDPRRYELVVNATPLGRGPGETPPFDLSHLAPGSVVVDLVYRRDRPTRLVHEARERGCTAIDGREVLLHQALPQFELMTGRRPPPEPGYELLGLEAPA